MQDTLQQRLEFIGLGEGVEARLAPISASAAHHLDAALQQFNARIVTTPSAARFLYGRERIEGEAGGMAAHWRMLVAGQYDAGFAEAATRTGHRLARIGVDPRWHAGSYALVMETLIKGVIHDGVAAALRTRRGPLSLLGTTDPTSVLEATDVMAEGLAVLIGGMVLDLDLSLAGYVDRLRQDADVGLEAQQSRLRRGVEQAGQALASAAEGRRDDALMRLDDPELAPLRAGTEKLANRMIGLVEDLEQASNAAAALACEALRTSQTMIAGRSAQAAEGQALATVLANEAPALAATATALVTLSRRDKNLARRCSKGRRTLDTAKAALDGVRQDANQRSALTGCADALGFEANMLAARLAAEGSTIAADNSLAADMRALALGLAQLVAQLRAAQGQSERAIGAVGVGLNSVEALLARLGGDLDADQQLLADLAREAQQRVDTLADAVAQARHLETALMADHDIGVAAESSLLKSLEGAAALVDLAAILDGAGEDEPEPQASGAFPAPDQAALAAHWHVL